MPVSAECLSIGIWRLPIVPGPANRDAYWLEGVIPTTPLPIVVDMTGVSWSNKDQETVCAMVFGCPGDATIAWSMNEQGLTVRHQWNMLMVVRDFGAINGDRVITATVDGEPLTVTLTV